MDFRKYLEKKGVSENTVSAYLHHTQHLEAAEDPQEEAIDALTGTGARRLAPMTRRLRRCAFKAWGRAQKDQDFLDAMDDVKLPAAIRQRAQLPLPVKVFAALRAEIDRARYITDPVRAELGIMANRGLRKGDVLRLKRIEVTEALKTGTLAFSAKGERRLEFGVTANYRRYLEMLADAPRWTIVENLISKSHQGADKMTARKLRQCAEHISLGEADLEDVRPHILRRNYCVAFYEKCGHDLMALKSHMGWTNLATASGYVDAYQRDELDLLAENMFS